MNINILYEDNDVVAVEKPAGLLVHEDGKEKGDTLSFWMEKKYPESIGVGEDEELSDGTIARRTGVVHRLDKDTSGVIVLAKTSAGFENIKQQFKDREVAKMYVAFTEGEIKTERGVIQKPIATSPTDFRKKTSSRIFRGEQKDAYTIFRKIKAYKGMTCVCVWPKTGRTHQIRVHLASIKHPIVGDYLYGKKQNKLGFKRTALHARSISFKNLSGKTISVEAPFPDDFKGALEVFGLPENDLLK